MVGERKRKQPEGLSSMSGEGNQKILSYMNQNDRSGLLAYCQDVLGLSHDSLSLGALLVQQWAVDYGIFFIEKYQPWREYFIKTPAIQNAMAEHYKGNVARINLVLFEGAEKYMNSTFRDYYTDDIRATRTNCMAFLLQLDSDAFCEHWNRCEGADCMNDLLKAEYNAALEQCGMSPPSSSAGSVSP